MVGCAVPLQQVRMQLLAFWDSVDDARRRIMVEEAVLILEQVLERNMKDGRFDSGTLRCCHFVFCSVLSMSNDNF